MNQQSLYAVDQFFKTYEKIKKNELPETAFGILFSRLSEIDYRNEHQKKIDYYITVFKTGALKVESVPEIERTARNSPQTKKVKALRFYCEKFLKEHYKHVQQPFWKKYKKTPKQFSAIESQEILIMCKTIQGKKSFS
jgi:hypothetical protein